MTKKKKKHAGRAHARYGPSSLSRIMKCPVSAFLSHDMEQPPKSKAASEGEKFHEVAEIFTEAKLMGKEYPEVLEKNYSKEMQKIRYRRSRVLL